MSESRFIADSMLGRLAKWLRLAGLDVSYNNDIEDKVLINMALWENRVILTRDRNIKKRKIVKKCLLIDSDHLEEQIRQFFQTYKINGTEKAFCRCIRCNTFLKDVDKHALTGKVPAYVLETNDKFKQCDSCNRIYWAGTHRENAERFLRKVTG
ncbi:MAG: Mut7-C RNAse domain-containing protein [Deltaproteobacteria bacterium]|nr:Mut7-C RNAse domain-containing protein [Deltaproteobacteria bacterium]